MCPDDDPTTHAAPTLDARTTPHGGAETTPDRAAETTPHGGAPAEPAPSTPLAGDERYALGDVLGRGGMGEVVAAVDRQLGREIAIKRMRGVSAPEAAQQRFMREARIQGRLDHPAIPPVHELGRDADGQPYFTMRRLAGVTLAQAMRDDKLRARFSPQRLLRALADVCFAIEYAHSRGVIHRDLKPSNIMLGEFGEVYVIDWGVARLADETDDFDLELTAPGAAVGTPGFMAPEQILGQPDLDSRVDVYALGCILFELLAGEPLHPAGHRALSSALDAPDGHPSTRAGAAIVPELDELCARAVAADRHERLSTARALGEAIQHYLDGDRDLALRDRLATEHVEAARAALAGGDGEAARTRAMREAGHALALAPGRADAAALVGHLMLSAPREIPRAVLAERRAADAVSARRFMRLASLSFAGYLIFVPAMLWIGVTDFRYLAAFTACAVACIAAPWLWPRPESAPASISLVVCNTLLVGLCARIFTPMIVAPGVAVVAVMLYAQNPATRGRQAMAVVVALMLGAIGLPTLLELAGALPPTVVPVNGVVTIRSPAVVMDVPRIFLSLSAYLVGLFGLAAVLAARLAADARAARLQLQLQAWHLRQLVPIA